MQLQKLIALIALPILLAGCLSPQDKFDNKSYRYVGQTAKFLFDRIGLPNFTGEVAGQKFYSWVYQNSDSITLPQYNIATLGGDNGSDPEPTRFRTYSTTNNNYQCVIKAFVNADDIISEFEMDGNIGGCIPLVKRL